MRKFQCPGRSSLLLVSLVVISLTFLTECQYGERREEHAGLLKLTLALQPAPYSGLIAVAEKKGFFEKNGVDVALKEYPSGLDSLTAMRGGEAEVCTVSDIAFASQMNVDPSLRIISSIGLTVGDRVVARKDRDICQPCDLKGKKVGYSPNTVSDYHLYAFLLTNHLSPADITKVAIPPARQVESIVSGQVDAVSAFEIYAFAAEERLGNNAVSWESQNNLDYQWLLATRENTVRSHESIKRLLKALIDAEDYALTYQDETKTIISDKWGFKPEYIRVAWTHTRLNVSLSQSIITALQSYSTWYTNKDGTTGNPPDVLSFISTDVLGEIDPKLITVFR